MEALWMLLAEDKGKSEENRLLRRTTCALGFVLQLHGLSGSHSTLPITLWGREYHQTHLTDGETEAQGKGGTCQRVSSM